MALTNHRLLNIHLPAIDALMENLDSYRPSLKSDIQNVTNLLSCMVEDRCLPDEKLWLEMLTDEQIASGELATNSLEELLKVTDEASYYTHSDPSHSATEDSPSPGERGNTSTSFPEPDTTGREDVGMTISSAHEAYLSSPLQSPEMEWFRDCSLNN
jgi:hypothetical protein